MSADVKKHTLTWLHLSDLHACKPRTGWHAGRILEALQKDLALMRDKHGLEPDLIFFTGDAAFGHIGPGAKSIADQFLEAESLFDEICRLLRVDRARFFLVPGNHDVNREQKTAALESWLDHHADLDSVLKMIQGAGADWSHYMARLAEYREHLTVHEYNHLLADPSRLIYSNILDLGGLRVGIAGLNTAWSCGREKEKAKLWFGARWQIDTLLNQLAGTHLRIALSHHPSNWFGEQEDPDAQRMLERDFQFHLHGHEHQGWVNELVDGHVRIAAGACYAWTEKEKGYNLVRLELDGDGAILSGEVWLRWYDNLGGGWVPKLIAGKTTNDGLWRLRGASRATARFEPAFPAETHGTPAPPTSGPRSRGIFGRDEQVKQLSRTLGRKPFLALYGMPGIGKTEIVRELHFSLGMERHPVRLFPETGFPDLYRQLAPALGCRDDVVELPLGVGGSVDFSPFKRWARETPVLIHLEGAHHLFAGGRFREPKVKEFFLAIARLAPETKVVLELREQPPPDYLPDDISETIRVRGLDLESMCAYFREPQRGRISAWDLSDIDAHLVFARLGGKKGEKGHALPLAMVLLGQVAEGVSSTPAEVFQRYPEKLSQRLEDLLFHDLYDNVLSDPERKVLQLCALYRADIPDLHIDQLNRQAGDKENKAFDRLKMRCLLNFDGREEWYSLHQVIRELTQGRFGPESEETLAGHAAIGEAWLSRLQFGNRPTLPNILAASEAAYHLTKGERFDRLGELSGSLIRRDLIPYLVQTSQQLHSQARHKDNRRLLELLVAIDLDDHKSHRFLGETIEDIEGKGAATAREHHAAAYRLAKNFAPYVANFARWLVANGERDEALGVLDEAEKNGVTNDHLRAIRASILQDSGDEEQAARLRQQQIQRGSRNPAFYNDEAVALRDKGQFKQALEILDLAEQRGITDDHLRAVRASILQESGDEEQATRLRQQQIQSGSRHPAFYNDEAVALRDKGQFKQALEILDLAERRGISDGHSLAIRASILQRAGSK